MVYCHPNQNYYAVKPIQIILLALKHERSKWKFIENKNTCKPLVASMEMLTYNLPDTEETKKPFKYYNKNWFSVWIPLP